VPCPREMAGVTSVAILASTACRRVIKFATASPQLARYQAFLVPHAYVCQAQRMVGTISTFPNWPKKYYIVRSAAGKLALFTDGGVLRPWSSLCSAIKSTAFDGMTVFGHGERMRYGLLLITLLCCCPALAREHGGGMHMHSIGPERMARVDPQVRVFRMTPLRRDLAPVHQAHVNIQDERRDILTAFPIRSTEVNDPQARIARTTPLRRDFAPVHQAHVNIQDERLDILTGFPVRSTEVNDPNVILTGTPSMEPRR
jgi:hypothetical protein